MGLPYNCRKVGTYQSGFNVIIKNMKNKNQGFLTIVVALVVGALVAGGALALLKLKKEVVFLPEPQPEVQPKPDTEPLEMLQKQRDELLKVKEELEAQIREFGATVNPVAGAVYYLSGSGVSGSATSFTLTSLTMPQTGYELLDADFSDTFYVTLEPGSRTRQEIASCTTVAQSGSDNTATVSGCTRGLLPYTPFTASTTYQFAHGGGTAVIFSNPPQLYEQFPARADSETITGIWTFSATNTPRYNSGATSTITGSSTLIHKQYADELAIAGVSDANYTDFGGIILATTSQLAAGTATSTATRYLVAPSQAFGSSSASRVMVPVTQSDGTIKPGFLPLDEAWTHTATTTFDGNVVISSALNLTATTTLASFWGDGSDGAVTISASTTLVQDMQYASMTINTGVVVNTAGFKIFVANTLQSSGTIQHNGTAGGTPVASSSGAGAVAGSVRGGSAGGTGASSGACAGGGGGGGGGWVLIFARIINNASGTIQANGANGAAGVVSGSCTNAAGNNGVAMFGYGNIGGAGGAADANAGGSAGAWTTSTVAVRLREVAVQGGYAPGVALATGGGAGGGGGALATTPSDDAGGGGGGGGGLVAIFYRTITLGTEQATAGSGGAGASGGAAGVGGTTGTVLRIQL